MDTTRYVLGVLLVVSLPPAIFFWLLIHPLVGFWRRVGPLATYSIVSMACVSLGVVLYSFRAGLVGVDLGANWMLIPPGAGLYSVSVWISVVTRRQLKFRTLAGLPEVSASDPEHVLLQDGIYGVVRHPRYVSVVMGTAGCAILVNHVGTYLTVLASIPALLLVVAVEERELALRFGAAYQRYRSQVPAFIPRLRAIWGHSDT